jgi:hypothetical protein
MAANALRNASNNAQSGDDSFAAIEATTKIVVAREQ